MNSVSRFRSFAALLPVIITLLIGISVYPLPAHAQIPLVGPLLATVPAAQDRVILTDLGSNSRRELVAGSGLHNLWGFSPDGCQLLLTLTDGRGLGRMVHMSLDGSTVVDPLIYTELPADQWGVWEPQWSPAGDKIAFTLLRDGFDGEEERQYHIAWLDPTGEPSEPAFYSRTGREHTPQWSPDGNWLAYVSYEERIAGVDIYSTAEPTQEPPPGQVAPASPTVNEADLWLVSADGNTKYPLTSFGVGSVAMPRWSPDSELLAFVYSPAPNNDTQWIISRQQGSLATQLTFNWNLALDLTWLPDGTALLATLRDFRDVSENRLWQVPLIGNGDTDARLYDDNPAHSYADYPRFSADGTLLAFRSSYGLFVLSTATRELRYQEDAYPGNTPPVWSPAAFAGETGCNLER